MLSNTGNVYSIKFICQFKNYELFFHSDIPIFEDQASNQFKAVGNILQRFCQIRE
jgi:hypothetical protein